MTTQALRVRMLASKGRKLGMLAGQAQGVQRARQVSGSRGRQLGQAWSSWAPARVSDRGSTHFHRILAGRQLQGGKQLVGGR
jgi:hypothetical protein